MLKYYQYKLSTLHGKKTKQPVFTVTLIRCIGFNQPPHNLASEQSCYNIVDKADHNVYYTGIVVTRPPSFFMFAPYGLCVGLCMHRL